jgi:hypothetical protein
MRNMGSPTSARAQEMRRVLRIINSSGADCGYGSLESSVRFR